ISGAAALAVDANDDLFVANEGSNDVAEYTAPISGAPAPAAVIQSNVHAPDVLSINSSGTVFVGNGGSDNVTVYAGSAPTFTQTGSIPQPAFQMCNDSSGNLYIADYPDSAVLKYTSFSNSPAPAAAIGLGDHAIGVAIDRAGTIYGLSSSGMTVSAPPFNSQTSYALTHPSAIAVSP
ncbi:MAG: hypothetical protein JO199_01265, partial [Candidatus Eremiobacteraeota bacterium]|nr:hypothetical protein [Candidatus Eremiobacteraeota bacterium]